MIASVVLNNATRAFDKEYYYLIPMDLTGKIKPGIRVMVPFGAGNRPREAYVIDVFPFNNSSCDERNSYNEYATTIDVSQLKDILRPVDEKPVVDRDMLKLAAWMRERYICTFGDAIKCMYPAGKGAKEKTLKAAYLAVTREEAERMIQDNKLKKIQHIRVLEMLMDNEFIPVCDVTKFAGVSSSVLDTLKKYGLVNYKEVRITRNPLKSRKIRQTQPLVPTPEQAKALDFLKKKLEENRYYECLIHGVTGSGKTEVYLQLIHHAIDMGKEAIVLVPEISLTPQMVERFRERFGNEVAVLHSRLSQGERYDQWSLVKDGHIKVVVGARSAVFAPLKNLGIIIIDEEHEGTYKSETTPKYHAAEIARKRCYEKGAMLLYGSATPSCETYFKAKKGLIGLLELKSRTNNMVMPEVEIVDMRKELEEGNRSVFSRKLQDEIKNNIKLGQQTMLFLNRRGHSSFVLCRNCGYVVKCVGCSINMTYHAYEDRLICHYCGYTIRPPKICPKCKSTHIRHFGAGTQKVEEEVKKQFPGCSVIRMDIDTTTCKNSHEKILRDFCENNINVMVGTQMIAKGHDFHNVTLVGVLAADSLLNLGDYRASERTFQLITQVAGRAGRGDLPGRVIIQAYNTEDFSIQAALRHDFETFFKQEIMIRKKLNYPPFTNIASIILSGANEKQVSETASQVKKDLLKEFCSSETSEGNITEILGPVPAPIKKIMNKYRWRIIIKCEDMEKLIKALTCISDKYCSKTGRRPVELGIDINPFNML